jgi:hypothetical protein
MKLKLYAAACLMAMTGLVSCGGDTDKEVVDKSIIPAGSDTAKAVTTTNAANNTATTPNGVIATPVNMQQPGTVITTPDGKAVALPGGGPVAITPVAGQTNAQAQNNVVMTPVQTQAQPTAPGMNPPHGQPGHRCDISVGAPLNSKPAAPATPATVTTTPAQPQVTMKEVPTTTKTAPGMNPPHGEPGHRCDIAVGAPLNSKPAAPATVTTTTAPAAIVPPALLTAPKSDSTKN